MHIQMSSAIQSALGSLRLGIIEFKAEVKPSEPAFWDDAASRITKKYYNYTLDQINKIETIAQTREAYKKCGKDPNRYRPSADSLMRRIVKGNELYRINNVVDILNLVSVLSGFSIGGYDKSCITGKVFLEIGLAGAEYTGIGRGAINIEGLPVLRDNVGIFGSPTSDSEKTMITNGDREIAFVFFDFGFNRLLPNYLNLTAELLRKYTATSDLKNETIEF